MEYEAMTTAKKTVTKKVATKKAATKQDSETSEMVKAGATFLPPSLQVNDDVMELFNGQMDSNQVEDADVLIPKILVGQGTSKKVKEGKVGIGDIYDSVNGEILCKRGESVELILFEPFKTWVVMKVAKGGTTQEFDSIIPYNSSLAQEEELADGSKIVRYVQLNYHSALTDEIAAGTIKVRLLSFRSTSYKQAKAIESERKTLSTIGKGLPLCVATWSMGLVLKENDKGSWFVPDISKARGTRKEEATALKPWMEMIASAIRGSREVKYDHSDIESDDEYISTHSAQADGASADY
jgi:hypothetical protein